jgi:arylsulfatase A-like enzyme
LVERIDQALDRLALAENTVVISTSGHGENLAPVRPPDRLGSFYEETVRVPFWVRVPRRLLAERNELAQALDQWRQQNVQNSDVLPTVRDFIGLGAEPKLGPPLISGRSLLRAPPSSSVVSGQSTCAFRVWNLEGFFAIQDRVKVIVGSDQPSPRLFDLASDPAEQKNLWSDPQWRAQVMPWLARKVEAGEERRKLCARIPACPIGR